jgi:hypothetical protein
MELPPVANQKKMVQSSAEKETNTVKPHKAKSLKAATRNVRSLLKQRAERDELLNVFDRERKMLAKLSADTPQFFNPFDVMEAKTIRDRILKQFNG